MKPIRLVVFDLDGTLVDSSRDLAAGLNAALARVAPRAAALPLEDVRGMIGDGARTLVARALGRAGLALHEDDVLPVFLEEYERRLLDTTVLYPGVEETLEALRPRTLAVLTNKPGGLSRRILEGLGVSSRFAHVYGGGDLPLKKPDPSGLRRLLEDAGVGHDEAVMVGDSAVDVRTGREAGVFTVGVSYGLGPEGLREVPPDLVLDDIRELPGALARRAPGPVLR